MQWPDVPRPLVILVGPTAVGKTALALELAEHLDSEIVSADSRLLYRGMDIGTAKPTAEELSRVPHHLIDVAEPDENWSLALFKQAAQQAIAEIHNRGRMPLLVGGTGQYMRAIVQDWEIPTQQPDHHLRDVMEAWGKEIGPLELHRRLAVIDPQAAEVIEANNMRRTIRALEVIFSSGQRFSEQRRQGASPYSLLTIGLQRPRPELYERIDQRIDSMLQQGLLAEVQALLDRGLSPDLPSLSAIGYREMAAHLRGEMNLDEAVMLMKRLTRQFVRRQANWFKASDPTIRWFDARSVTVADLLECIAEKSNWVLPAINE